MKNASILQVVGLSQTGKTSLISLLLEKFRSQNVKCATIKSAKTHDYESSSKDSDIFLNFGSENSTVIFNDLIQMSIKEELDLQDVIKLINSISKPDLIIIEGFKEMTFPKIIIWSNELSDLVDSILVNAKYLLYKQKEDLNNKELQKLISEEKLLVFDNQQELIAKIIQDFVQ